VERKCNRPITDLSNPVTFFTVLFSRLRKGTFFTIENNVKKVIIKKGNFFTGNKIFCCGRAPGLTALANNRSQLRIGHEGCGSILSEKKGLSQLTKMINTKIDHKQFKLPDWVGFSDMSFIYS